MLKYPYFIIYTTVAHTDGSSYPIFHMCAETKSGYVRIADLKEYLKDGKSGLTNEVITNNINEVGFVLINQTSWKSRINNRTFYQ